jgi:carboxyl-terminal processing protease
VQVKSRDGKPSLLNDNDPSVLYDGPLAVMVNEFSASASEIFAAAIQDYNRGVIVGTTSYGKGTVQTSLPLGKPDMLTGQTEYGALKITFQKFYRVNGGSTQVKGVTPDVVLPDTYEYLKFREKDNKTELAWDQIDRANYEPENNANLSDLEKKEQEKVNSNATFSKIKNNTEWLGKNVDREYYLNIYAYKKEQSQIKNAVKQNDSLVRLQQPLDMKPIAVDNGKFYNNADTAKGERFKQWLKNAQTDIYVKQTVDIVKDIMGMQPGTTVKE